MLIRGANFGKASEFWSPEYLKTKEAGKKISAHVCPDAQMNFATSERNYTFRTMGFGEFIKRCAAGTAPMEERKETDSAIGDHEPEEEKSKHDRDGYYISPHERYYLRSLAKKSNKAADFFVDYPELANDFTLPSFFSSSSASPSSSLPTPNIFSSVFRASSPALSLWTHYDITDNILCHIQGRKRVLLFPPKHSGNLYLPLVRV